MVPCGLLGSLDCVTAMTGLRGVPCSGLLQFAFWQRRESAIVRPPEQLASVSVSTFLFSLLCSIA